ncbi:MAG: hypothetical protein ABIJ57_02550 [Pseudomonadota bacterium]
MAKKSSKQALTCDAPRSYKPEPRADFAFVGKLPDGLPEMSKPVTLLVTGKLTRVSQDEYPGESNANLCLKLKKVVVQKQGK